MSHRGIHTITSCVIFALLAFNSAQSLAADGDASKPQLQENGEEDRQEDIAAYEASGAQQDEIADHEVDDEQRDIAAREAAEKEAFKQHPYLDDDGNETAHFHVGPLVRNYVLRPLTTPKGTFRFFAGPGDPRMLSLSDYRGFGEYGLGAESRRLRYRAGDQRISTGSTVATLKIGSVYGLTNTIEAGFGLPFTFGPGSVGVTADIPVWITGRVFKSEHVELGLRATGFIPVANTGAVQVGLPLIFRRSIFRIDSGIFGTLHFNDPLTSRVLMPMRLSISFVDAMYVGFSSGIDIRNFDALAIPLGFHVLFVLEYDKFIMDLGLSFLWPAFVHVFANDNPDSIVGTSIEDSLGHIRGRHGVDFNDFDVQIGANLAIRF